jgi:Ricin-type beta-trefoil lectin domain
MKKAITILFALPFLLVLWANGKTHSNPIAQPAADNISDVRPAGNIADGMYTIMGWSNRRCLEVPNSSCSSGIQIQTFDCDATETSNNQKFNIVSDGSGNYTISPVHSDLCLEVSAEKISDRAPILQTECSSGKASQKWSMSQYGENLEIRDVQNNQCLDIMRKVKGNYGPIFLHACGDGTNQRWVLHKTTLNVEKGVICRASPSHPEYACTGVNDQQKEVHLGKTLTKARCEEACQATKMVSCRWAGSK